MKRQQLVHQKSNRNTTTKTSSCGRILVTVNVLGSPGEIRLLISEEDSVGEVIHKAFTACMRQGRLPVLKSSCDDFYLYSTKDGVLDPGTTVVGCCHGCRNFLLCKKASSSSRGGVRQEERQRSSWKGLLISKSNKFQHCLFSSSHCRK